MSFATQLRSATGQMAQAINTTWKRSVLQAFTSTIIRTPVLDGYAKGSWLVGQNNDGQIPFRTEPDLNFSQKIPDIGGTVLLYSNMPYIERLEDGYSTQAPAGMVKVTVSQWPGIVRSNRV